MKKVFETEQEALEFSRKKNGKVTTIILPPALAVDEVYVVEYDCEEARDV